MPDEEVCPKCGSPQIDNYFDHRLDQEIEYCLACKALWSLDDQAGDDA